MARFDVCASAVALAFTLQLPCTTVLANSSCTGELTPHLFDGSYDLNENGQGTGGGWGSEAWINVRAASLCSNPLPNEKNHISAWALMGSNPNPSDAPIYLAQAGYRKLESDTSFEDFVEWSYSDGSGTHSENVSSALSNGTNTHYQVYYNKNAGANGEEEMNIGDGTYTYFTPYNPDGTWPGPWNEEWSTEIFDGGDDIPGSATAKTSFTSLNVQPGKGSVSWQTPVGWTKKDTAFQGYENNSSGGINVWQY